MVCVNMGAGLVLGDRDRVRTCLVIGEVRKGRLQDLWKIHQYRQFDVHKGGLLVAYVHAQALAFHRRPHRGHVSWRRTWLLAYGWLNFGGRKLR